MEKVRAPTQSKEKKPYTATPVCATAVCRRGEYKEKYHKQFIIMTEVELF